MNENNKERPFSKLILEMGPLIIFFVCYYNAPIPENLKNDLEEANLFKIIFATKIFVPAILVALFLGWFQTKKIAKMPLITAILVVVFGGLTIWLNNPIFIKMKPTLIYLIFSAILGYGLLKKKIYLKILMGPAIPMNEEGWLILSKRFVGFFVLLAFTNEIIWRFFSQDFWVNFKTFGLPILLIFFMALQFNLFNKYSNK
ncbi:MAG: inner membrane-spanning protein YciB [Pseudomonadota bacterium]|nr:inner membrane-spanning protein YciB [Pseudomonadota bacterium]